MPVSFRRASVFAGALLSYFCLQTPVGAKIGTSPLQIFFAVGDIAPSPLPRHEVGAYGCL